MTKKFCWTDEAVGYVFRRLESFHDYVFAESELTRLSAAGFKFLKTLEILKWQQYDWEHELYVSHLPGDVGTVRYLRKRKDGKYWAYPEDDDEKSRIVVEEKDLPHYHFKFGRFAELVKEENGLEQEIDLKGAIKFIGSQNVSGCRTGVFLTMNDSGDCLETDLKALPNCTEKYARYIVVNPFTQIVCQQTKSLLTKIGIRAFTFEEVFDEGFKFKKGFVFAEAHPDLPQSLHLTGRIESEKHIVLVDNHEGGLTDANFVLLLKLIIALNETDEGWIATGDGDWQAFGRLKDDFKRAFKGFDFDKFIENGRKKYRLVILKDAVTFDLEMLNSIKGNAVISGLVDKLAIIPKPKALTTR